MATIDIIPDVDRTKDYYGSIHKTVCTQLVTVLPEQILGSIPVEVESSGCFSVCYEPCFIEGDISGFLFKFPSSSFDDNYKLERWDGTIWSEVVTGNPNNVLGIESGTKFDVGYDTNYTLYGGFKVDWGDVFGLFGGGKYRFVVDNTTPSNKLYSAGINLKENTCDNKDGTVYFRFESYGRYENFKYTESNGMDRFYDLIDITNNWVDGCRYEARIEAQPYETEQTEVKLSNFSNNLHYSEERAVYNLIIFRSSFELFSRLYLYGMDSFNIQATDGNSDAPYDFDSIDVIKDGSNEFDQYVNNKLIYNTNVLLKSKYDLGFKTC